MGARFPQLYNAGGVECVGIEVYPFSSTDDIDFDHRFSQIIIMAVFNAEQRPTSRRGSLFQPEASPRGCVFQYFSALAGQLILVKHRAFDHDGLCRPCEGSFLTISIYPGTLPRAELTMAFSH